MYVKIMPEFCSDGTWNELGASTSMDEYGFAPEILVRLKKWNAQYDREMKTHGDEPDVFPYEAFAEEGEQIARHIKATHPEWTVLYWNEYLFHIGAPRGEQTYEIEQRG